MAAPNMDRIEVKIVTYGPGKIWNSDGGSEAKMQKCFDDGFLLMRADTTNDSVVYIFTRTIKQQ